MTADAVDLVSSGAVYRRLLGYSMRYWPMGLLALVGMGFDAGCASLFTYTIKPMLDEVFVRKDSTIIFWMPIFIIALFLVRGTATFCADYGIARIGRSVVMTLREEVFGKYLKLPAAHFGREPSGRMISRMTYTVEQVANASTDALKVVVLDGLMVIGQITVMLLISVRLTLALFVLAPLVGSVVWFVGKRYRAINRRIQDSISSVTGIVDEAVGGFREVKVYGGGDYERSRFAVTNRGIRSLNLKVAVTNALSTATVQLVAAIALALVIFLATRPATLNEMSPGSFMALITAMMLMLPSMKRLTTVQANLGRGIVAARDIFEVIDAPEEVDDGELVVERARGDIEFQNVGFRYPGTSAAALRDIDLHCPAGTVTALVGRSGGGKSSLISLLPRFHDV
ncbi:MAG: ABC transporter transmembrane domain-containing protein, partial [Dokdonella sp.]